MQEFPVFSSTKENTWLYWYLMAKVVNITSTQRSGAYADVVRFLTEMSHTLGNATNAAAVLLRKTPEYTKWRRDGLRRRSAHRKAG